VLGVNEFVKGVNLLVKRRLELVFVGPIPGSGVSEGEVVGRYVVELTPGTGWGGLMAELVLMGLLEGAGLGDVPMVPVPGGLARVVPEAGTAALRVPAAPP
jgi:hypothetical protein